jgi:hypothetical protein
MIDSLPGAPYHGEDVTPEEDRMKIQITYCGE